MAETIRVAVAANVSYAIDDLKKEFNKLYPNTKVQVILGSTGKLTAQIKNKASYDILMGANMRYPESLYAERFAVTRPLVYAQGSLALISAKKYDLSKGIETVKNGGHYKTTHCNAYQNRECRDAIPFYFFIGNTNHPDAKFGVRHQYKSQ